MEYQTEYYDQEALWQGVAEYQKNVFIDIEHNIPDDVRTILDVGCGDGFVINRLCGRYDCTGVDISKTALRTVRCRKLLASATELPFEDNSFDLVMINDVLEHLGGETFVRALGELQRVARKYVLVTVPFMENLNAGMTFCRNCGHVYHITHHVNSFGIKELMKLFDGGALHCFKVVYSGSEHLTADLLQYELRSAMNFYTMWDKAMCPACGKCASDQMFPNETTGAFYGDLSEAGRINFPHLHPLRNECITLWSKAPAAAAEDRGVAALSGAKELPGVISCTETGALLAVDRPADALRLIRGGVEHLLPRPAKKEGGIVVPQWFTGEVVARLSTRDFADNLIVKYHSWVLGKLRQSGIRHDGEISALQTHAGACDNAIAAIRIHATGHDTAIANLQEHEVEHDSMIAALQTRTGRHDDVIAALQTHAGEHDTAIAAIRTHAGEHDTAIAAIRSEHDTAIAAIRTHATGHDAAIANLQGHEVEHDSMIAALQSRIRLLEEHIELKEAGALKFYWRRYKKSIEQQGAPSIKADLPADGKPRFTVICHDQEIDRRIIQQVERLTAAGWTGVIVCLSFDGSDHIEEKNGYWLHRIGLNHIVPDNKVYWYYHKFAYLLGRTLFSCKLTNRLLFRFYQICNVLYYRCYKITDPLPFSRAFTMAGAFYPAELVIGEDLPALKAAATLAQAWGSKLVFDSHEFYPEQRVFSSKQKRIMHSYTREYIGRCNAVITVSDGIADKFSEYYRIPRPLVLHNVADRQDVPASNRLRETLSLDDSQKIILYQGGIIPDRNIDNLVSGFAKLDPDHTHLVLLGPSDPDFLGALKKRAGALLSKKIHFLEAVPQRELLSYTASADFGVVPYKVIDLNTKYCIPNKFFEYIQAELPVLANELVEVGKILGEIGGGGLVADLNSPGGVARALRQMLERDLGQDRQALKAAKTRFSWDFEGKSFMELIDGLK